MACYKNQKIWFDGRDLTASANVLALASQLEANDVTTFADNTRKYEAGLFSHSATVEGFYAASTVDADLFEDLGIADKPFSTSPEGTVGAVAYCFKAIQGSYTPMKGAVGDAQTFSAEAMGTGPLVRGQVLYNGTATSTGVGTGVQVGVASSTQRLYGILHVLSASGTSPTLDVVIESDNANNFPSDINRITFAQMTDVGSQWIELAGPITDDWHRVSFTIGGTGPSFTFAVILAIQ